jgi:hypothetical protein
MNMFGITGSKKTHECLRCGHVETPTEKEKGRLRSRLLSIRSRQARKSRTWAMMLVGFVV